MKKDNILTIDIGGTGIKAAVLNTNGEMLVEYQKIATPKESNPENILKAIKTLIQDFPKYDVASIGFPGFIKAGITYTAPNLQKKAWDAVPFAQNLANNLNVPTRLLNDADLQGYGLISGAGLELILTLGTGFGTALFVNGISLPHLELGHFNARKGKDYDAFVGNAALEKDGEVVWNKKIKEVLKTFKTVINYDKLYLSGGNAKKISFALAKNIEICGNKDGIKGGALLWKIEDNFSLTTFFPNKK